MKVYCYYFNGKKKEDNVEEVRNSGRAWRTFQCKAGGYVWIGEINKSHKGYFYSLKELTRREIKILDNCWE